MTKRRSSTTFAIKKEKKGFRLTQTTRSVFTNFKPRKTNLGTFKTKSKAKLNQRLARKLVGRR